MHNHHILISSVKLAKLLGTFLGAFNNLTVFGSYISDYLKSFYKIAPIYEVSDILPVVTVSPRRYIGAPNSSLR